MNVVETALTWFQEGVNLGLQATSDCLAVSVAWTTLVLTHALNPRACDSIS